MRCGPLPLHDVCIFLYSKIESISHRNSDIYNPRYPPPNGRIKWVKQSLQFTAAQGYHPRVTEPEQELRYIQALSDIVETGQRMLEDGRSALDVVTEAVRLLEECPLFNAGIGAVYTRDETHELDACVMDGNTLNAGAVAGISHLRNPILAARLVMEHSPTS